MRPSVNSSYREYYTEMPDGTVKQVNPLTGTEVWCVPGRRYKPIANEAPSTARAIVARDPEDHCNFCPARMLRTPPEKSRLVVEDGRYRTLHHVPTRALDDTVAIFRRVPNLFEIVTVDYWVKNFGYRLSPANERWRNDYLSTSEGREHALEVVEAKLRLAGLGEDECRSLPIERKLAMTDAFFGGGHELVIGHRHYREGARFDTQLHSSGDFTPELHYEYLRFTIETLRDIYANNRYVRYIATFQNWLRPAGASFDHLHKQLVALDEWGTAMERELESLRGNPNVYNELAVNFAAHTNRVLATNEHAIAFVEIGRRYPTVAVYSRSPNLRPEEHTPEELRGVSDLLHAMHAAVGSSVSTNEEWYFAPRDCVDRIPWHVLVRLRINTSAGFEGGTRIFINPIPPLDLRDQILPRLLELRERGAIASVQIGDECDLVPNPLRYLERGRVF